MLDHLLTNPQAVEIRGVTYHVGDCAGTQWQGVLAELGLDPDEAAQRCAQAIAAMEPHLLLFLGSVQGHPEVSVGDVIAASSVAQLDPRSAKGSAPEPRAVAQTWLVDCVENLLGDPRWSVPREGDRIPKAVLAELAAGREVVASRATNGDDWLWGRLQWARAVDSSGWDFIYGQYAQRWPASLAVYGVRGDDNGQATSAAENAVAFASILLTDVRPIEVLGALERDRYERPDVRVTADADLIVLDPQASITGESPLAALGGPTQRWTSDKRSVTGAEAARASQPGSAPAPDLKLTITLNQAASELRFHVESPSGRLKVNDQEVGVAPLKVSAEEYRRELRDRLKKLTTGSGDPGLTTAGFGSDLYQRLVPDPMKQVYENRRALIRELQEAGETVTLQIVSNEPWIPWELVKPVGPADPGRGGEPWSDDYLSMQFALTRWLPGQGLGPEHRMHIGSVVALAAGQPPTQDELPSAGPECEHLVGLLTGHRVEDISPGEASHTNVMKVIAGATDRPVDLWHVAAHGKIDPAHLERSAIVLADGKELTTEHLDFDHTTALGTSRPMVFFNACLIAQQGMGLTGLTGWPQTWIERCRCGAFIGPQWVVGSELAAHFAKVFYEHVAAGHRLGAAALAARRAVRKQAPDDPAFLAYCVFGHPNASAEFGARVRMAA